MQLHREIRTKDGIKIWITTYTPELSTGKVLVIAPTGGVTKRYYHPMALYFENLGFHVVTFDYRGMGNSAPQHLKGFSANMHQWAVQDIDAVLLYARNNYPGQEIIYLGHCIGGEIVGLAQASQYINRLVLVNSALSCKRLWPWKDRFRLVTLKTAVRLLNKWFGYFPGKRIGLGGDLPKDVVYEWANWCNSPNGLFDAYPDNNYRKLQIPLLAFSFSDDWLCPANAVEELLNHFCGSSITWHHFKPYELGMRKIGHTGFFNPIMKPTLWLMMLGWLTVDDFKMKKSVVNNPQLDSNDRKRLLP